MEKQKICIIGGGLTGLVTAITLSKLNCHIDIITNNIHQNSKLKGTLAISQNNLDFLKKLNIFGPNEKFWHCSKMELYTTSEYQKIQNIFELNKNEENEKVFYMLENSKIINLLLKKIKKDNKISIKNNMNISEIKDEGLLKSIKYKNSKLKYNLIIICTGGNSDLARKLFNKNLINYSYKETSITTIVKHNSIKNDVARQIFMEDEILAMLPISNNETSIVWSVKKNKYKNNKFLIRKKINFYIKNYYKKIKFVNKLQQKDLNFLFRNNFHTGRTLLFGDALHQIHPLAGQGFNIILRDLSSLEKILGSKIKLGLDIGTSDILFEFSNEIKPRNFAYLFGINLIKNTFSYKNNYLKKFRDETVKVLNRSKIAKEIIFKVADKGIQF